jgi:hypothetical protein
VFRGRAIAGTCLALALVCALAAPVARAGTYEVAICHDPASGLTVPADGISFPTSGAFVHAGVYDGCGRSGYLYATLDGIAAHGPSDIAAWEFQAPAGTTIAAALLYRAFYVGPSAPYRSPIDGFETISSSGAANVLAVCAQTYACLSIGTGPLSEFAAANVLDYGGLSDVVALQGNAGCGGGQVCDAGAGAVCPELGGDPCIASNHLYAMVVTLEDDTAPVASNVSGSLVAPGDLAGVAGVSFAATDAGSGLYSAAVTVDGAPLAGANINANGGRCVPIDGPGSGGQASSVLRFDWTSPCALAGSATLSLDTSALADGAHSVAVTVSDAAGNTATAWAGVIHTDNAPKGGIPQVFGDAQQGQTLIAGTGSWSPAPTGYAYQWERCDAAGAKCAAIAGATAAAYAVTAADAYGQIAVVVTASDADGSTSSSSQPSGVVLDANGYASPPPAPTLHAGSLPQVSGAAREGATLTAQPGAWSGGPLSYGYEWERCDGAGLGCSPIAGALGSSYVLVRADDYERVRVLVRASGPGGTSEAASDPTRVIADASGATIGAPGSGQAGTASQGAPGAPGLANGKGGCRDARLRATLRGSARVAIPWGRSVMLRGALECGGAPVSGALVAVELAPAAGAAPVRHAEIRTAADGSFAYLVAAGPSRRITLSYRAFSNDPKPSARASASVLVTPTISLAISPTHTVNGHTITFSGRVSGGEQPRGGVPLQLEYLEGNRWMIYDVVRTRPADGRFTYRYTFRRTTQSITYTFRVAIPAAGVSGYPFQPAASPARSVHVDP